MLRLFPPEIPSEGGVALRFPPHSKVPDAPPMCPLNFERLYQNSEISCSEFNNPDCQPSRNAAP